MFATIYIIHFLNFMYGILKIFFIDNFYEYSKTSIGLTFRNIFDFKRNRQEKRKIGKRDLGRTEKYRENK